jgi:hypothetical protein
MIFQTAGRRVEVDTEGGFLVRLPLFGEVWRGIDGWGYSPWSEVKAQLEAQETRQRNALVLLSASAFVNSAMTCALQRVWSITGMTRLMRSQGCQRRASVSFTSSLVRACAGRHFFIAEP